MKPISLQQPKLPPVSELERATVDQLTLEARLEQILLAGGDASNANASNMSLDEAVLERIALVGAKLEKLSLMDTALRACDLSAARCSDSSMIRVHIVGGRLTGTDLSRSTLKDAVFEDCKLDMANFRFAKLTRVQFVDCNLTETDFQAAELTDVIFQSSHLEKTEFGQCKVKNVDARGSQLFDIRGWQSLKGLAIDTTQLVAVAPQLAIELGLIIKE